MPDKIFQNAKWIVSCKILQSLMQFVVGMLSARYLGPSNYGLISYAAAIVAFALPIMQLGLRSTLVQEYVDHPENSGIILGTCLTLNLLSAIACMVGVTTFSAVANPMEKTTIWVCALYSFSLLFQAVEMIQYWFQAKLLSKYSSLAMLLSYFLVSAYKIYLLATGKSVYWFAVSHALEYGAAGLFMFLTYLKVGDDKVRFSFDVAKEILGKSRHYIVATLMVTLYNVISTVLLKQFIDEAENGFYAAAVTCTSITAFVFTAIIDTARPVILQSKNRSIEEFEQNVSRVYSVVTWLYLAQSLFFTVFAGLIVRILYGDDYLPTVSVLRILVWRCAFSEMGVVRNIWILGENKHTYLWIINLVGVITSLIFNLLLIPRWGACGAAAASVLVQIFTNIIMGFLLKPIRRNNYLLLRGLNPKLAIEMIGTIMAK